MNLWTRLRQVFNLGSCPRKSRYKYYYKCLRVIDSCKAHQQLITATQWCDACFREKIKENYPGRTGITSESEHIRTMLQQKINSKRKELYDNFRT